jgi:hypothetical protein
VSIYNNGPVIVYLRPGAAAAITDMALAVGAYYTIEATSGTIDTLEIHGITAGGVGSLAIEEWT